MMRSRLFPVAALATGTIFLVAAAMSSPARETEPAIEQTPHEPDPAANRKAVKVMTLNTAHGRGTGRHQLLQRADRLRTNLDRIGDLLNRERPALVAFQEVDGASAWSGNFCHVRYLAENAGFSEFVRGELINKKRLSHGLALASRLSLSNPLAVTFTPAPGGTAKGFVVATIEWPESRDILVDVVSVHFEAFRPKLRARQIKEFVERITARERPVIVMGDLNMHWERRTGLLPYLVEKLNLKAHKPLDDNMATFRALDKRLDWILVSNEFDFRSYETLGDPVSDHNAVIADIVLTDQASAAIQRTQSRLTNIL